MVKRIDLVDRIEKKSPRYLSEFRYLFEKFCKKNARDSTELGTAYDKGMFFSNYYQLYLYAAMIGLKHQRRKEIPRGADTKIFGSGVELGTWNPQSIRRFLIAAAFSKADIDWNALESLPIEEENKIDSALNKVKGVIEAYANGGLEILAERCNIDEAFFDDDKAFVDLIQEIELN